MGQLATPRGHPTVLTSAIARRLSELIEIRYGLAVPIEAMIKGKQVHQSSA
jgi:hypothetical protein